MGGEAASARETRYATVRRVTLVGSAFDLALALAKIVGGLIGQSQALVADGVHSASDLVTDVMVLLAAKHAHAEADEEHPYGHGRIETLATVLLGAVLILVAVGVVADSVRRLLEPSSLQLPATWVLLIAAVSVVSKEASYHYTIRAARRLRSSLLRANAWHSRSDAISSVVVIVGVGGSLLGMPYLDGVAAVIVAWMIARVGLDLARGGVLELIDTGLDPEQVEEIRRTILEVDGVQDLHQLRTRQMGGRALVDVHIILNDPRMSVSEGHQVSERVRGRLIHRQPEVDDVTVHIDPEDDEIAAVGHHLPPRAVVEQRLERAWAGLPEAAEIRHLTLHYLDGRLHVDLELPLSLADGDAERARALAERFREATRDDPDVEDVRLLFV
jgi:cation diffusion facilitator family transporter